ncbi:hypothetical protein [Aurantimonas sp. Leaf443]|uniref:hypothetical protein n=1 Tax=Aurantimonas sp. Leaf443 TaxID=1736378 RepID=UPI0006F2590E|nr:hypothetical protein [Aurantimonas sp. Leaf443]KQT88096.1 hypothetical protein ASG48_01185 [Aurantimonas sp. Leaf443]
MRIEERNGAAHHAGGALEAVEFELALDLHDPQEQGFEDCVRQAASVIGGEILFDMPADGSIEDASRIAAIRIPGGARERIVFAVLDAEGVTIRVPERQEVGERFYGFARAFVGVLTRIRDDLSFARSPAEGSA